jgi:hypothetical protein
MPRLYRVLKSCKIRDRTINPSLTPTIRLSLSKKTEELAVANGALSPVYGPPIKALPGWESRGALLEKVGIDRVEDLLVADASQVAKGVSRTEKTVRLWQKLLAKEIQ